MVCRIEGSLFNGAAWRRIGVAVGLLSVAVLAGCGSAAETGSEVTLASWRDSACATMKSRVAEAREPMTDEENALAPSPDSSAHQLETMQKLLAELRKIPLPTQANHRADVETLIEMFATVTETYEEAMPRIEAASRRLDRVLKSVDDDTPLPPAPEGSTVAGGIMSQMMSIPGVRDAMNEYMAAVEAATSGIDEEEAERLEKRLGLEQCGVSEESREEQLSDAELDRCAGRGRPVSVQELVEVFRENDITLELNQRTCAKSATERSRGAPTDATNAGPSGLSQSDESEREEGSVLCHVGDDGVNGELVVNKYPTDSETTFSVHNVRCALYPYSTTTEAEQIARVKKAMQAIAALTP